MTPNFFLAATMKKNLGRFYTVDFTGYPSNQFSGYRLNDGRLFLIYFAAQLDRFKTMIQCADIPLPFNSKSSKS